ncbi:hypothetical protein HYH03_004076 [Edaphochlamys debaryana]|uniref:Uncharacterized protein n=1 Tax=Edaphochlamys debaryana TaxID=47281 RepID=A0A835Y7P8_9CHLO|nr:hypothetical protein HYH03_004076 [Edaphochlamys debaryana]|eukprot:KAG2497805.1 hypothetical protein HYH03_004076 [Edaphochlamys debaryana]
MADLQDGHFTVKACILFPFILVGSLLQGLVLTLIGLAKGAMVAAPVALLTIPSWILATVLHWPRSVIATYFTVAVTQRLGHNLRVLVLLLLPIPLLGWPLAMALASLLFSLGVGFLWPLGATVAVGSLRDTDQVFRSGLVEPMDLAQSCAVEVWKATGSAYFVHLDALRRPYYGEPLEVSPLRLAVALVASVVCSFLGTFMAAALGLLRLPFVMARGLAEWMSLLTKCPARLLCLWLPVWVLGVPAIPVACLGLFLLVLFGCFGYLGPTCGVAAYLSTCNRPAFRSCSWALCTALDTLYSHIYALDKAAVQLTGLGSSTLLPPPTRRTEGRGPEVTGAAAAEAPAVPIVTPQEQAWTTFEDVCAACVERCVRWGWVPREDLEDAEAYLFIGLPALALLQLLADAAAVQPTWMPDRGRRPGETGGGAKEGTEAGEAGEREGDKEGKEGKEGEGKGEKEKGEGGEAKAASPDVRLSQPGGPRADQALAAALDTEPEAPVTAERRSPRRPSISSDAGSVIFHEDDQDQDQDQDQDHDGIMTPEELTGDSRVVPQWRGAGGCGAGAGGGRKSTEPSSLVMGATVAAVPGGGGSLAVSAALPSVAPPAPSPAALEDTAATAAAPAPAPAGPTADPPPPTPAPAPAPATLSPTAVPASAHPTTSATDPATEAPDATPAAEPPAATPAAAPATPAAAAATPAAEPAPATPAAAAATPGCVCVPLALQPLDPAVAQLLLEEFAEHVLGGDIGFSSAANPVRLHKGLAALQVTDVEMRYMACHTALLGDTRVAELVPLEVCAAHPPRHPFDRAAHRAAQAGSGAGPCGGSAGAGTGPGASGQAPAQAQAPPHPHPRRSRWSLNGTAVGGTSRPASSGAVPALSAQGPTGQGQGHHAHHHSGIGGLRLFGTRPSRDGGPGHSGTASPVGSRDGHSVPLPPPPPALVSASAGGSPAAPSVSAAAALAQRQHHRRHRSSLGAADLEAVAEGLSLHGGLTPGGAASPSPGAATPANGDVKAAPGSLLLSAGDPTLPLRAGPDMGPTAAAAAATASPAAALSPAVGPASAVSAVAAKHSRAASGDVVVCSAPHSPHLHVVVGTGEAAASGAPHARPGLPPLPPPSRWPFGRGHRRTRSQPIGALGGPLVPPSPRSVPGAQGAPGAAGGTGTGMGPAAAAAGVAAEAQAAEAEAATAAQVALDTAAEGVPLVSAARMAQLHAFTAAVQSVATALSKKEGMKGIMGRLLVKYGTCGSTVEGEGLPMAVEGDAGARAPASTPAGLATSPVAPPVEAAATAVAGIEVEVIA